MEKQKVYVIRGIPILATRKHVKNLSMRIRKDDGQVLASIPLRMPEDMARDFFESRAGWLLAHRKEVKEQANQRKAVTPQQFASGESLTLWGTRRELLVHVFPAESERKRTFRIQYNRIEAAVPESWTVEERQAFFTENLAEELKREMKRTIPVIEGLTGLHAAKWTIRPMKTRWGSCTIPARTIRINYELVKYPKECLHGVILHELLHIVERYHNAHFYALMTKYMPDWRTAREKLKR